MVTTACWVWARLAQESRVPLDALAFGDYLESINTRWQRAASSGAAFGWLLLFLDSAVRPLAVPPPSGPRFVRVLSAEEKGSDVNLASHLIHDGWKGEYEAAVVVTNDTDLEEPIRIVAQELRKPVGLICPKGDPASHLKKVATFIRRINNSRLARNQFPVTIPGTSIRKPAGW